MTSLFFLKQVLEWLWWISPNFWDSAQKST